MIALWLTTAEIAELAGAGELPGVPETRKGVDLLATREGWSRTALARPRKGREGGGGMEYHVDLLPLSARSAYFRTRFGIVAEDLRRDVIVEDGLTERERLTRDARLATTRLADRFRAATGYGARAADVQFCDLFNGRSMGVAAWVFEGAGRLSPRTLARWRAAAQGAGRLAYDPAKARKGSGLLETAEEGRVKRFVLTLLAANPHFSGEHVRTQCRSEFGDEIADRDGQLKPMPPLRTFQHFVKQVRAENKVVLTKLTDPDRYRSHYAISGTGALRHITEANQLWQIDASPWDALCLDGRHSIYACIDIASRRPIVLVSRTPRASAVGRMVRKAILRWGIASTVSTDNGSDFTAHETKQLFDALDIDIDLCEAFSPEQKGHVERVIKTFQHSLAPLLPGFIGHSVADRKAIEGRKSFAKRLGENEHDAFAVSLTGEQLQAEIDAWIDDYYEHRKHEGLRGQLKGMSPMQAWAACATTIRTVDERALEALLMPSAGLRTVTKRGIRVDGYHYMTATILPGTTVFVRLDPADKGIVHVYSSDRSAFLGTATCPELADVNPAAFVRAVKEEAAERMRQAVAPIKAELRRFAKGPSAIERARKVHRRDAEARAAENANVIPLPPRSEPHVTQQIAAALEARAERRPEAGTLDPRAAERQRKMIAAMQDTDEAEERRRTEQLIEQRQAEIAAQRTAGLPANVTRLPETPKERFRRAATIRAAVNAGEAVAPADAVWLGRYEQSAEYRSQEKLAAQFANYL